MRRLATSWTILFAILVVSLLIGTLGCPADDSDDDDTTWPPDDDDSEIDGPAETYDDDRILPEMQVGFGRVDITPKHSVIMAGYGLAVLTDRMCRWSTGSHDPIYASAVAFDPPQADPILLITLDTIGIILPDADRIRQGVTDAIGVAPDRVVVSGSHSHGSPDTMGLWGVIYPMQTGRDDAFIEQMIQGGIDAATAAFTSREPATLEVATGNEDRLHYNPQAAVDPQATLDNSMTLLGAYDADGRLIGSLMSWGCHPMVMGPQNTLITADFPGAYYRWMEQELGGIHMFVNTTLGGTVHPVNPLTGFSIVEPEWGTWKDVDDFGRILADDAAGLLQGVQSAVDTTTHLAATTLRVQVQNPLWMANDLIPREVPQWMGWTDTRVTFFSIGNVRFGTVPGELVPDLGLALRKIMGGEHRFLINLGMDWFGYILTADQFFDLRYIYFSALCIGPGMEANLVGHYRDAYANWP